METTNLISRETIVGQAYCVTTDRPCTVLAQLKGRMMPLLRILKGQGVFIAPARTVYLTTDAHITKSFSGAALSAQGSGYSEVTHAKEESPERCSCEMEPHAWVVVPESATEVKIKSDSMGDDAPCSMMLELKPTGVVMPEKWLTALTTDGTAAEVRWIAGEPTFPASGLTYIIGLTQRSPKLILANLLATY